MYKKAKTLNGLVEIKNILVDIVDLIKKECEQRKTSIEAVKNHLEKLNG